MPSLLVHAHKIPTAADFSYEGREYVLFDDFIGQYKLDEFNTQFVRGVFNLAGLGGVVEKRIRDSFFKQLMAHCHGKISSHYSPIVTVDGWVYWVGEGHHESIMSALSLLYSHGQERDPDFLIHEGLGWRISTTYPNIIFHGQKYCPSKDDREIFQLFEVSVIGQ